MGPNLLENRIFIKWHFRQPKYAVSADLEDMFIQVIVTDENQSLFNFFVVGGSDVVFHKYTRRIHGSRDSPKSANFPLQKKQMITSPHTLK